MARRRQTKFEQEREAARSRAEIARKRAERKRQRREIQAKRASREVPKPRRRDPTRNFLAWAGVGQHAWRVNASLDSDLERLIHSLSRMAPKTLTREHVQPIKRLVRVQQHWLRPLSEWKPTGASKGRQLRSLIEHLLCKYPTPAFLLNVFHDESDTAPNETLYVHLAQGGSVAQAIEKELLPTTLTKKMAHNFMSSSQHSNVLHAVRRAQIEAFGGEKRIVKAVCETRMGRNFDHNEEFWLAVVQWVCNQPMMNPGQIGPIFDWVFHSGAQNQNFSMKGRTALSVLRDVEAWHGELAKIRKAAGGVIYPKSGFPEDIWEVQRRMGPDVWSCTEVLTSRGLAAEGRSMRHCVYSYSSWCSRGRVSIWSLRCNDTRQLTLEVNNQSCAIVQARGICNAGPTVVQRREMGRWASFAGLRVSTYAG